MLWGLLGPAAGHALTLYGLNGNTLYTVDRATAALSPVQTFGAYTFMSGLALDPTTGLLWATANKANDPQGYLVRIDPITLATGEQRALFSGRATDLTFLSDGTLLGNFNCSLGTIRKTNGQISGLRMDGGGCGIGTLPDDRVVYASNANAGDQTAPSDAILYELSLADGSRSLHLDLTGRHGITALAVRPDGAVAYGMFACARCTPDFVRIDLATGEVALVGTPSGAPGGPYLTGLAFVPEPGSALLVATAVAAIAARRARQRG
jgi:hypothetical protein